MNTAEFLSYNWSELVFDSIFIANAERLAKKRFNNEALEGECVNYLLEKLSEDDWQRCRAFKDRSKPTTFLYTLASNLIEEFARKKFGRPRPPTWLKNQGELWVNLWKTVCLERQLVPVVIDRFAQNGLRKIELIQHAIKVIKARIPTCGQAGVGEFCTENINASSDSQQHRTEDPKRSNLFESHAAQLYQVMMESILVENVETSIKPTPFEPSGGMLSSELQQRLQTLRAALNLTDQEALLLRMIYIDGMSKSTSSLALGLPSHQGGRIVKETLERIKKAMLECDLDVNDLLRQTI